MLSNELVVLGGTEDAHGHISTTWVEGCGQVRLVIKRDQRLDLKGIQE